MNKRVSTGWQEADALFAGSSTALMWTPKYSILRAADAVAGTVTLYRCAPGITGALRWETLRAMR
jgi:hypothetical protein